MINLIKRNFLRNLLASFLLIFVRFFTFSFLLNWYLQQLLLLRLRLVSVSKIIVKILIFFYFDISTYLLFYRQ